MQPHVERVDTLNRRIDPVGQTFTLKRLMSLHYSMPSWAQRVLMLNPRGYGVEEATVDLRKRTLTLKSHNHTFSSFFRVDEVTLRL